MFAKCQCLSDLRGPTTHPYIKFERNLTIRGGVINDMARFRRPILREGDTYLRTILRGTWAELYQFQEGNRAVIGAHRVCLRFQISRSFSKRGRPKSEGYRKFRPNFTLFPYV